MKINWMSLLALGISIIAIFLACIRLEPVQWGIDATNLLVDVLAILVTILIGFQIVNYFLFEKKVDAKIRDLKKHTSNMITEHIAQTQEYIAGIMDFSKAHTRMIAILPYNLPEITIDVALAYRLYLSAIMHFVNYNGNENMEHNIEECLSGLISINKRIEEIAKDRGNVDILKNYMLIENEEYDVIKSKIILCDNFRWTKELKGKLLDIEKKRRKLVLDYNMHDLITN